MLSLFMKCVGMPMPDSPIMKCSLSMLFRTPLPSTTAFFLALWAVTSSLKYCTTVPGFGPS